MVMAAVIVLAGAGVFAWLKFGRPATTVGRLGAVSGATVSRSATPTISPTVTQSVPSVTPTQTSPGSTLVPVAPGVANNAQTAAVDAFVTEYFAAINAHNYRQYLSLISPANRQNWTVQTFDSGYGSTTDSQETLISITHYGSGVTGATLSFISHQLPSQSATGSSCTDWESVTLFLRQSGGRYFIGTQLPGYHPQYSAC
jgi:hypothetical protein